MPYSPIQSVRILLSTATFDVAEKYDKYASLYNGFWFSKRKFSRVNLESALGVIGGTMGLFTGFSVLSAVEIVYYALKYLSSSSSSTTSKISKSLKPPLK